jgi:hypothetical protein
MPDVRLSVDIINSGCYIKFFLAHEFPLFL